MFKSVGMLAATGIVGLIAIKFLGLLLLPLLGMFLGFVMWALKIALIVGLLWFGWKMWQRLMHDEHGAEA
jgi:TRAP-type C4-dicarboxylate transport system permease small subunit